MIMNAQPSQMEFPGIPAPGSIEIAVPGALYADGFRRSEEKIRSDFLPPAAADCAWGVGWVETRSRNEDEKLSTEPGQLQTTLPIAAGQE
jgi:hypothetical protein